MSKATGFSAGAAERFADHPLEVRGAVRYEMVRRNLGDIATGGDKLKILDIGGGAGIEAEWLHELGHEIVLVEPSEAQAEKARRRFSEKKYNVKIIEGSVEDVPGEEFGTYDLALCHCVAMYTPNPAAFIASVIRSIKPGGHASILEKGYYGAEARMFSVQSDATLEEIQKFQKREPMKNNTTDERVAFKQEELEEMIVAGGGETLRWHGVRVISDDDKRLINMVDKDWLEALFDAEEERGNHESIRGQGQMYQFIARRKSEEA